MNSPEPLRISAIDVKGIQHEGTSVFLKIAGRCDGVDCEMNVGMLTHVFETLINQGQSLMAAMHSSPTCAEENAALRKAVWPLLRLTEPDWRMLLWEMNLDCLVDFLWFMNDPELTVKATRNISSSVLTLNPEKRAAMMREMIEEKFGAHDPDNVSANLMQAARQSVHEMMKTLIRLEDEGRIPAAYPQVGI